MAPGPEADSYKAKAEGVPQVGAYLPLLQWRIFGRFPINKGKSGTGNLGQTGHTLIFFSPAWSTPRQSESVFADQRPCFCYFLSMARLPRVIVIDVPHYVTQRGNARQIIFSSDAERFTYLELPVEHAQLYGLGLIGSLIPDARWGVLSSSQICRY